MLQKRMAPSISNSGFTFPQHKGEGAPTSVVYRRPAADHHKN